MFHACRALTDYFSLKILPKIFIMSNAIKKHGQVFLKTCMLLTLFVPVISGFSTRPPAEVTCPAPSVSITAHASTYVSFALGSEAGGGSYQVWYHRKEDNFTSSNYNTGNTYVSSLMS
jgi:hypothetical protein